MTDVTTVKTLGEYKDIDLIDPSPLNPRKTFHQDRLRELAESVKAVGIIEPLVVRPLKGARVEIVAGERRFRAAKTAGLTALPVVVRYLTDAQVLELMAIENEQRDDIHPLERAAGYQALMTVDRSFTADVIAHRIGKSKRWVQLCLQYLTLVPEAQQAFRDGKITSGHADLLVRLHTPDDQRRALAACFEELRLIAVPEAEQEQINELRYADEQPAKKSKKTPAVEIPHRLRSTRELADWIDTHVKADREELKLEFPELQDALVDADTDGRKVVEISHLTRNDVNKAEYSYDQKQLHSGFNEANKAAAAVLRRVVFSPNWERADGQEGSKPCEHSVLGVVTFGHGKGEQYQVCVAKKTCKVHWGDYQKDAKDRARVYGESHQSQEDRAEQEARWKREGAERERQRKLRTAMAPAVAAAIVKKASAKFITKYFTDSVQQLARAHYDYDELVRDFARPLKVDVAAIEKATLAKHPELAPARERVAAAKQAVHAAAAPKTLAKSSKTSSPVRKRQLGKGK